MRRLLGCRGVRRGERLSLPKQLPQLASCASDVVAMASVEVAESYEADRTGEAAVSG